MNKSGYTGDQSVLLLFNIIYYDENGNNNEERIIKIHKRPSSTVEDLKEAIFYKSDIPLSKQVISGWYRNPESGNDPLGLCCSGHEIFLTVKNKDNLLNEVDAEDYLLLAGADTVANETTQQNEENARNGQAQVIETTQIGNILNQDQVGVSDADIGSTELNNNGVKTDVATFVSMDNNQVVTPSQSLPSTPSPNDVEISHPHVLVHSEGPIMEMINTDIQEILAVCVAGKVDKILDKLIPSYKFSCILINEANKIFQELVRQIETAYQCELRREQSKDPNYKGSVFMNMALKTIKILAQIVDFVCKKYFEGGNTPTLPLVKDLILHLREWLAKQVNCKELKVKDIIKIGAV